MLKKTTGSTMFPNLFQPGYIGKLKFKNRLIKAPLYTRLASSEGCVTDRMIAHYRELARGGAGLVIVEFTYIDDKASSAFPSQLGASHPRHHGGLSRLAAIIKENYANACLQIHHAGLCKFWPGPLIKVPSRVAPLWKPMPGDYDSEELTIEEIKEIVESFGNAAMRAEKCGFDMVEVNACHGYLITNFLSAYTNRRKDMYGGSLNDRMRFLLEVAENIRKKVSHDYPLSIRLSTMDFEENGITIEETIEVVKALEKAGVNAIHQSSGDHRHENWTIPADINIQASEAIKSAISIPVICSGSIMTPELGEKILQESKADFISYARPIIADPYLPLKAQEDRPEDIAPCIQCAACAVRGIMGTELHCSVNAAVCREEELRIVPVPNPKRVAIIGGGPAGMEAARVAALRGHDVTLFEERELGGMLIEASTPESKANLKSLIKYLITQINKTGVKVIKSRVTSQEIRDHKFDAVIVATGATPCIPDVPGIQGPTVSGFLDVLKGTQIGKNIIVIGGGLTGCDIAVFLSEQGKKVTIIEMLDEIARGLIGPPRTILLEQLSEHKTRILTGVYVEEITENSVLIHDKCGAKNEIKGDNIVIATGLMSNTKLFNELNEIPDLEQVYAVGDCVAPRFIYDAIHEGYLAAYGIT